GARLRRGGAATGLRGQGSGAGGGAGAGAAAESLALGAAASRHRGQCRWRGALGGGFAGLSRSRSGAASRGLARARRARAGDRRADRDRWPLCRLSRSAGGGNPGVPPRGSAHAAARARLWRDRQPFDRSAEQAHGGAAGKPRRGGAAVGCHAGGFGRLAAACEAATGARPGMTAPLSRDGFARLTGVSRETLDRLEAYVALLRSWNRRINLVGRATIGDVWRRHILDSWQLQAQLDPEKRPLVDIGSGAGLPGVVLAILGAPAVHLIEVDLRKAAFLAEALRVTGAAAKLWPKRSDR